MAKDNDKKRNPLFDNWNDDELVNVLGANLLRTRNYGEFSELIGEKAYDAALGSERIGEMREKNHAAARTEYRRRGVYGEPPRLSDSQISASMMRILEESALGASLKDLESLVKDKTDVEMKVPDKLKDVYEELYKKVAKDGEKSLTKDEKEMFVDAQEYQARGYEALRTYAVLKLVNEHAYDVPRAAFKKLDEKYNPAEESSK